jgi:hypothetical protein
MKKLLIILALCLSGCSTVKEWIPSFWDDNQSAKIISVRLAVERVDCTRAQAAQVAVIRDDLEWFRLYSDSKGWRQQDVLKLVGPMQATTEEWYTRVSAEGYKENPVYCALKKKVMQTQADRAAKAVLGRF